MDLREDILDFQSIQNLDRQELTNQFDKVKTSNPEIHEILILMYDELQKEDRVNKKNIIRLIDKALLIKTETIYKMIQEKSQRMSWADKIRESFTWNNFKRLFSVILIGITFVFLLYKIDPTAVKDIFGGIGSFTHEIIKETK